MWQPQPQALGELVIFLRDAGRPDTKDHYQIQQRLDSFRSIPDYNAYLVFILVNMTNEEWYTRQVAGLTLKNNICGYFNSIPLAVLDYIKSCCCAAATHPDAIAGVRTAVGSVIAAIVTHGQACNWPEILELLVHAMDSSDPLVVEMGFDALGKICEDAAHDLDQDMNGVRPLNYIIPRFVQAFRFPQLKLRVQAMVAVSQFILLKTQALMARMNDYLDGLLMLMHDREPTVRQELCNSLTMLLEARPDKLAPILTTVIEYVIDCMHDPDNLVALRACDFWLQYTTVPDIHPKLVPYLDVIIPALLQRMVYTETDLLILLDNTGDEDDEDDNDGDGGIDDANVGRDQDITVDMNVSSSSNTTAKEQQDLRPRFYRKRLQHHHRPLSANFTPFFAEGDNTTSHDHRGNEGEGNNYDSDDDDEDDLEDDDFYSEWTLRKGSASALEVLSIAYPGHICGSLMSHLDRALFQEDWKIRESGILALGAVAEGGMKEMTPILPRVLPYLLGCLNDNKPLIRSIACWVLGRYSDSYLELSETQQMTLVEQHPYFETILMKLLEKVSDRDHRVQLNACSSLAVLFEKAGDKRLIPYLDSILQYLTTAFTIYQHRNFDILYDTLSTLAETVKGALNRPDYIQAIVPPLTDKWNSLSDRDTGLFPLFQCLSLVTAALGTGFTRYSEPVFGRCVKIIANNLDENYLAKQRPDLMLDPPDAEFIVAALDLLSGMVQGMNTSVSPLVTNANPSIFSLITVCLEEPRSDVLQSTCALTGDLAVSCFDQLQPHLPTLMPLLIEKMESKDADHVSVCSNAIWALGEIAMRSPTNAMVNDIPRILQRLLSILPSSTATITSLKRCYVRRDDHRHNQKSSWTLMPSTMVTLYENVVIAIGRFGLQAPAIMSAHLQRYARPWLMCVMFLPENDEKDTALTGFCQTVKANPFAAEKEFGRFVDVMVACSSPSNRLVTEFKDLIEGYQQVMKPAQWSRIMKKLEKSHLSIIDR